MRLVSQDGKGDMPYENFIFRANGTNIIASRDILTNEKSIVAEYSTVEKALKVMEMMKEEYLETVYDYRVRPKVFQFPKDEDVEV